MSIKEWPESDRPREKLVRYGVQHLSDGELISIFVRTGVVGQSALDLARTMLQHAGSLRALLNMSQTDFCQMHGVGIAKFVQFQAALELGKRYQNEKLERRDLMRNPQMSSDYLHFRLRDKPYECFYVLFLDTKHRIIHQDELFRGTVDSAQVPIREVVKAALKHNAASLIVAHNHPSGVAEPSQSDERLTKKLVAALELVGIRLLDHFVVGDGEVISFAQRGLI